MLWTSGDLKMLLLPSNFLDKKNKNYALHFYNS